LTQQSAVLCTHRGFWLVWSHARTLAANRVPWSSRPTPGRRVSKPRGRKGPLSAVHLHHLSSPPTSTRTDSPNTFPCPDCILPCGGPSQNNRRVLIDNLAILLCVRGPNADAQYMIPSCTSGANGIPDSRDGTRATIGCERARMYTCHRPARSAVREKDAIVCGA